VRQERFPYPFNRFTPSSREIRDEVKWRLDGLNGFAVRQKAREEKRAAKKRARAAETAPEPEQLNLSALFS
jgi:hypothetical protein